MNLDDMHSDKDSLALTRTLSIYNIMCLQTKTTIEFWILSNVSIKIEPLR